MKLFLGVIFIVLGFFSLVFGGIFIFIIGLNNLIHNFHDMGFFGVCFNILSIISKDVLALLIGVIFIVLGVYLLKTVSKN